MNGSFKHMYRVYFNSIDSPSDYWEYVMDWLNASANNRGDANQYTTYLKWGQKIHTRSKEDEQINQIPV